MCLKDRGRQQAVLKNKGVTIHLGLHKRQGNDILHESVLPEQDSITGVKNLLCVNYCF